MQSSQKLIVIHAWHTAKATIHAAVLGFMCLAIFVMQPGGCFCFEELDFIFLLYSLSLNLPCLFLLQLVMIESRPLIQTITCLAGTHACIKAFWGRSWWRNWILCLLCDRFFSSVWCKSLCLDLETDFFLFFLWYLTLNMTSFENMEQIINGNKKNTMKQKLQDSISSCFAVKSNLTPS